MESVVFLPYTPESELRSRISKMDLDLKFRTKLKYVEELGRTVGQVLINKDPVSLDCGVDVRGA